MQMPENMKSLSVAWFTKEDWPQWCSIDQDFDPDFGSWLIRAESAFEKHKALGHTVHKVLIHPDEFLHWCRINGRKINSDARAMFATFKTMRNDTGN